MLLLISVRNKTKSKALLNREGLIPMTSYVHRAASAMFTEAEAFLSLAVTETVIQESHLKDLKNRTMRTARLVGLNITNQQRLSKSK